MPKSDRRRGAEAGRRTPRRVGAVPPGALPAVRAARDERPLLDRILETPHLARVVPRLQPEVLHRVIQTCGLEDCADLVALATPNQLARVFDLDLWRAARPGRDEELDADRFGVWLDVLMACGPAVAAQKLAGMDAELVIAALAQHLRVFDLAAISLAATDGDEAPADRRSNGGLGCEIGNYLVEARRADAWDTIVAFLLFLDSDDPDYFHRLMRGCRNLSNSRPEIDGLDDLLADAEQDMFDLMVDREGRREKQGYVTPAQARAFLQAARELRIADAAAPPPSPVARAYFRAIAWTPPAQAEADANRESARLPASPDPAMADEESPDAVTAFVDVLREAGVLPQPPRALLEAPQDHAPRLARIRALMQRAREIDENVHSIRTEELAYLANTIVAGCSIQARPFTPREASDAVAAACNLGLENWPARWLVGNDRGRSQTGDSQTGDTGTALPDDFLLAHDLISVFQVGWNVLHADVSLYAAERLIDILADLRSHDVEIQGALDGLRVEMTRQWRAGAPWRARDALDVIVILDQPAWATLLGLIDECPVIHAGLAASRDSRTRAVSASAFAFISENSQIASVRAFMASLPDTLRA